MASHAQDPHEILSGEAVSIDVQPVNFFLRVAGALIDMLVSILLLIALIITAAWLLELRMVSDAVFRIASVTAIVLALVVVPCAIEVASNGRSLGKLIIGGRIVRVDGGATTFRHAFIRALLGVLEIYMTFGAVALLSGALSTRSQRLGDLVAGTYSQKIRVSAPPQAVSIMPPGLEEWVTLADVARLPDRLARRIAQFLQNSERMLPPARARVAQELLDEAREYVSPIPAIAPEQILIAMTIVRRDRERRALEIGNERAATLLGNRR